MILKVKILNWVTKMFCSKCGQKIDENTKICRCCGNWIEHTDIKDNDQSSIGFAVVGFLAPLIGLIMFIIYHDTRPLRAKSVIKGVVIGFATKVLIVVVIIAMYMIFVGSMFNDLEIIIDEVSNVGNLVGLKI